MSKTIVINSGYFNPIHPGHIECMQLSKQLGDELWVIVNNDKQAEKKRGVKSFQDQTFRIAIVDAVKHVNRVYLAIDEIDENCSICKTLEKLILLAREEYGDSVNVIFAKGGDRMVGEVPESVLCNQMGVKLVDGLGAKTHNSSDFIKK
jgi:cytidyltransferase-like protein